MFSRAFKFLFLALIRAYQLTLSSVMGGQCRFHPTCSHYGYEAIVTHGPWRGGWLTIRRIGRCNPFTKGGYDPVPPITPCEHHSKETAP